MAELRRLGFSVTRIDGDGVPDLLCGYAGRTFLVEVKPPLTATGKLQPGTHRNSEGGRGDLKPAQVKWHDEWRGDPVRVVRTVADVAALVPRETAEAT
ncbi:MAG TPA: hypothetical protein VG963_07580 [Polyangiaceae bacterium]|nr:hypothetical protein [Polyangiaceae bacterium]